jgi:hypothetical protein
MKSRLYILWLLSGLAMYGIAYVEPVPGRAAFFEMLAGDWSISIVGKYEIGTDPRSDRVYVITKWAAVSGSVNELLLTEVKGVSKYCYVSPYIIAKTAKGYEWINLHDSQEWQHSAILPDK